MTYYGWPSLCLRVRDLEASKAFYMKLGMRLVSEAEGKTVVLRYGVHRIALMTFLDGNLINFRAGDVLAAERDLKAAFAGLEGESEQYTTEQYESAADGVCWATRDPDGNEIFFDTNELEEGPTFVRERALDVVRGAAEELEMMGADPEMVSALRRDVLARFAQSEADPGNPKAGSD
ncbi:MAG: VOC family protein [Myxococcota bacterium]